MSGALDPKTTAGVSLVDAGPVLRVRDLHVTYESRRGVLRRGEAVRAVDGVSFDVFPGEVLALVGESGCGKTSIARAVLRLLEPAAGTIEVDGTNVTHMSHRELRRVRAGFQMVFQDPYESLDPRQTVLRLVLEPLKIHGLHPEPRARREAVLHALERAGLHPPEEIARRYPHELSGGQRQRVAIAAAMVLGPKLLVADEPVSMLDVSLRAGILRLMIELKQREHLGSLFITHDLSLAWVIADRIAVVYLGRIVEIGPAAEVLGSPRHPYTKALVSVIPAPEAGAAAAQILLAGETPSPRQIPTGCRFHPRCWLREELGRPAACVSQDPTLAGDHAAACHFPLEPDRER